MRVEDAWFSKCGETEYLDVYKFAPVTSIYVRVITVVVVLFWASIALTCHAPCPVVGRRKRP